MPDQHRLDNPATSLAWNLLLITAGSLVCAYGFKALAVPHHFISTGVFGLGLYFYYLFDGLSPSGWYAALNIPIFILAWLFVSRRFFFYSLYGMAVLTAFTQWFSRPAPIEDPMLAALACGVLVGAGSGVVFRSLGSSGGLDIFSVIFHQRYNMPIARFNFAFNCALFSLSFLSLRADAVLYSMVMGYVTSKVMDKVINLFLGRKAVIVITERHEAVAAAVLSRLQRGATVLFGRGAFSGRPKRVLLTVVANRQLKRLEEEVFGIDPEAFMIVEDASNVLGKGFSRRKIY